MWENRYYNTTQIVTQNMITCILFLYMPKQWLIKTTMADFFILSRFTDCSEKAIFDIFRLWFTNNGARSEKDCGLIEFSNKFMGIELKRIHKALFFLSFKLRWLIMTTVASLAGLVWRLTEERSSTLRRHWKTRSRTESPPIVRENLGGSHLTYSEQFQR